MAHSVPPLPYDYNALEPHIDEQTMRIHHDKHHQAYVDRVNGALEGTQWADAPIEDVIRDLQQIPEDKRAWSPEDALIQGFNSSQLSWRYADPNSTPTLLSVYIDTRLKPRDNPVLIAVCRGVLYRSAY
jgi:Fe-Mn family superoxide dismutase